MATVASLTFTPARAGRLLVIVSYDVKSNTYDWGSAPYSRVFVTQGGSTQYGDQLPMSSTRQRHIAQAIFNVAGGTPAVVGIDGAAGSPGSATWWNVLITCNVDKK